LRKTKKRKIVVSSLLITLTAVLTYYQLLYKPTQVSSNIFKTALIFTGHTNEIWAVEFSPDGNLIASGGVDSTAAALSESLSYVPLPRRPDKAGDDRELRRRAD